MKLLDSWYAVALSSSLGSDRPLAVQLHGERFALWRDQSGQVAAVQDRCPHKGASLSAGFVKDGTIACGYHGWCFGRDGHCSAIYAQHTGEPMPHRAHTRAVPCREAYGFLWIWWARDSAAPKAPSLDTLPGLPSIGPIPDSNDSKWRGLEGAVEWKDNWLRVLEAFMDLTHAPFVDAGTFGGMAPDQLLPEEQWTKDDSIY